VELLGRLRSDRVLRLPAPPRQPGTNGRPPRHGSEFHLADPATWPQPPITTSTQTTRYGTAVTQAWDRLHPRLTRRAAWIDHDGALPILQGTLIRLVVDHLARRSEPEAGVAMAFPHRHHTIRGRPIVAGIPAPLRP
jgi:hypothetical protein